jgi:hypothetical protein
VVRAYFAEAVQQVGQKCLRTLAALFAGTERQNKAARLHALLATAPLDDVVELKRRIGAAAAERGKYPF